MPIEKTKIYSQAQQIADRLGDHQAIWFHVKCIRLLGFERCYELASLALDGNRRGKIHASLGRYYNGCVQRELREHKKTGK